MLVAFLLGRASRSGLHELDLPPVGIILGIVAGIGARKVFDFVSDKVDDERPRTPSTARSNWVKFVAAMIVAGRDVPPHPRLRRPPLAAARWAGLTGIWPGQESRARR